MEAFDYIIIGAGSAGCVLASRLSADSRNRVLLIEAGGEDKSLFIKMPGGLIKLIPPDKTAFNWAYWTAPQQHLEGRRLYWPRGKVVGGSSAINGMVYIRGHKSDYDRWAQLGASGWAWEDVLPYFKAAETYERGADDYHGADGPLNVARNVNPSPLVDAFLKAGREAGFPESDDFNGADFEGFGVYDSTTKNGERWSVARGYLEPVRHRDNLTIVTGSMVERLLLEDKRATGVRYRRSGEAEEVGARGEVIVSGGAINSPQILMLSGIGDGGELAAHGIPVLHELKGVGQNLQDHLDVILQWRALGKVSGNAQTAFYRSPFVLLDWLFRRKGTGSFIPTPAGAFLKTRPEVVAPDIQLHFMTAWGKAHGAEVTTEHGFQVHVCQLRPESRGEIRLASSDPSDHAVIDPNYLAVPGDLDTLRDGLKITREIVSQSAFDPYRGDEIWPGAEVTSDAELDAAIRRAAETIYHPIGTCKMGTDESAVVDPRLRVVGLDGLRVVDASIMPTLISGNTNAPTVMIAEKAAAMILADATAKVAA